MGANLFAIVAKLYGVLRHGFKLLSVLIAMSVPTLATAEAVVIAALGDSLTQGYRIATRRRVRTAVAKLANHSG